MLNISIIVHIPNLQILITPKGQESFFNIHIICSYKGVSKTSSLLAKMSLATSKSNFLL